MSFCLSFSIISNCPHFLKISKTLILPVAATTMAEIIDISNDDCSLIHRPFSIQFIIPRAPKPMARHRFFNGGLGNKCKNEMDIVRNLLKEQLVPPCPVPVNVPLEVSIEFYLRRHNSDFTNGVRGSGRLKSSNTISKVRIRPTKVEF